MSHPLNSILKVSVAAASLALLAGCATQAQDTSALEQQIQEAKDEALEATRACSETSRWLRRKPT